MEGKADVLISEKACFVDSQTPHMFELCTRSVLIFMTILGLLMQCLFMHARMLHIVCMVYGYMDH